MKQLINHITSLLESAYPPDEAQAFAWWIVEEETGLSRSQLLCGCKDTAFSSHMQTIVDRLLHFEPIQYIFGHTLWCGLDLKVSPATLIPRPETAELVEKILSTLNVKLSTTHLSVLDIGTGTGCIAIALQKAHPEWQVTGIDISEDAIAVAKENVKRNHVEVDFQVADIFDFHGDFDVVVSNPPYVCVSEKTSMRRNVLEYEPATALFVPDNDPLRFYRRIAESKIGKHLFFEINEAYPAEMEVMLRENGYTDIQITIDIYGKPRIIEARMA